MSADLPLEIEQQLDEVCDRFESSWRSGAAPRIELFLDELPAAYRPRLLRELLEVELEFRFREDPTLNQTEYVTRFPDSETFVQEAFARRTIREKNKSFAPPAANTKITTPQFGEYQIERLIGQGAMGEVYQAKRRGEEKVVALKVIGRNLSEKPDSAAVRRFQREAQTLAQLSHDHIVRVYDVGKVDDCLYYSMQFIDGQSLAQILREGPMDDQQTVAYLEPIARAIHFAHEQGVIHRDLKPQNILIDQQQRPYLTDFGLAKLTRDATQLTEPGALMGTLAYMAPEQVLDSAAVTNSTDIYALGANLFHCLTGRVPFEGEFAGQIMLDITTKDPPRPRDLAPEVNPALEALCLQCLQKEPAQRLDSAERLAAELLAARR